MKNWTLSEIVEKFQGLERDLLTGNTDILEAWYDIRFQVFRTITYDLGLYGLAHSKKKITTNKIFKLLSFFNHNPIFFIFRKVEYLFFGSSRRILQNKKYLDIYTDYITDYVENKTVTIEKPFEGRHYSPAETKCLGYAEKLKLFNRLLIKNKNIHIDEEIINIFQIIEKTILEIFNIKIDVVDLGKRRYKDFKKREYLFRFYFKLLKPKAVFVVCSYGKEYFVRAAKSLNIPVIELQHGVLNRYHMGYSFNKNLPKQSFPDYFFSFGDYWNNAADFPINSDNIFSIGYPYFEEKYSKYKNYTKNNKIIFISQGIIGKQLSKFAVDFSDINKDSLEIVYKLHPGEVSRWKTEYPWLSEAEEKGTLIVLPEQKPDLYELFAESVIQVGVNSTAIFEGYKLNCKTYIVDLPGIEYMDDFVSAGYGKIITKPEEITFNKKVLNNKSDELFKNNWKENILTAINKIENK